MYRQLTTVVTLLYFYEGVSVCETRVYLDGWVELFHDGRQFLAYQHGKPL